MRLRVLRQPAVSSDHVLQLLHHMRITMQDAEEDGIPFPPDDPGPEGFVLNRRGRK